MTRTRQAWSKLLSLTVHEFRTPITTATGYLRMLGSERVGSLNEQQRKLLHEAERSCARLAALVAELSDLANLEAGTAAFNRSRVDVFELLRDVVRGWPMVPDRSVTLELRGQETNGTVGGDPVRLRQAFSAVVASLLRDLVRSERIVIDRRLSNGADLARILLGQEEDIAGFADAAAGECGPFDLSRGGLGLALVIASRTLEAHGGRLLAPPDAPGRAGAIIELPLERA